MCERGELHRNISGMEMKRQEHIVKGRSRCYGSNLRSMRGLIMNRPLTSTRHDVKLCYLLQVTQFLWSLLESFTGVAFSVPHADDSSNFLSCSHTCILANKANLVHSLFVVYLFLTYLSFSTCFGRLCAHHQEKQLRLCETWYLLLCVDDSLVCRVRTYIHKYIHTYIHTHTHTCITYVHEYIHTYIHTHTHTHTHTHVNYIRT